MSLTLRITILTLALASTSSANPIARALASTARVLNFFPIPVQDECLADDGRRSGVCLNAYECRFQQGVARGNCALGFGVCCIFTETCGGEIKNNITYFVNPSFPGLARDAKDCEVTVNMVGRGISQLRLEFVHFNLAQPNRKTGACSSDRFLVTGGNSKDLTICGQNSGQHMYYDVENVKNPIKIIMNMTGGNLNRLWEIKVSQVEFNRRAPTGCMQFYQGKSGVIQTWNYAVNGRHLADHDYNICIRQEAKMCSIAYEPCDENSFKIGPPIRPGSTPLADLPIADTSPLGGGSTSLISTPQTILLSDEGSGGGPLPLSSPQQDQPALLPRPFLNPSDPRCPDRITMPCELEDFIGPMGTTGICELLGCGSSMCPATGPCRIESSVRPFNLRVLFGPASAEEDPDDNLGMCIRYEQLPCS